jgi:hypothetical protein
MQWEIPSGPGLRLEHRMKQASRHLTPLEKGSRKELRGVPSSHDNMLRAQLMRLATSVEYLAGTSTAIMRSQTSNTAQLRYPPFRQMAWVTTTAQDTLLARAFLADRMSATG